MRIYAAQWFTFLLLSVTMACCVTACKPRSLAPPVMSVDEKEVGDVVVSAERKTMIIDINSQKGIGTSTITVPERVLPQKVLLRLYLQGLEQLQVESAELSLQAEVSSGTDPQIRLYERHSPAGSGEWHVLQADEPNALRIRLVATEPIIPLKGGYFEVEIPASIWQSAPHQFTVRWIDFYRN